MASAVTHLLQLPDELLYQCGKHALAAHMHDLFAFRQTCMPLRCALPSPQQLRWEVEHAVRHAISSDELTVSKADGERDMTPWAACCLLPTEGQSVWKVRAAKSFSYINTITSMNMIVGVCDAAARHSWALQLCDGRLYHRARKANGQLASSAPPEGYPALSPAVQVIEDKEVRQKLYDDVTSSGVVIEVRVDHDAGTLSFHIDGLLLEALKGDTAFPKGAALRPFALCHSTADRIELITRVLPVGVRAPPLALPAPPRALTEPRGVGHGGGTGDLSGLVGEDDDDIAELFNDEGMDEGMAPSLLGHAAPFADPVPQITAEQMILDELVRQIRERGISSVFGATVEERAAHVADWSHAFKLTVAFQVGSGGLLSDDLRDELQVIMGVCPPPPMQ